MLGSRAAQLGMFETGHLYLGYVGEGTFCGFLARHRGQLFCSEDCAEFYSPHQGHPSVPPSLLANALLLRTPVTGYRTRRRKRAVVDRVARRQAPRRGSGVYYPAGDAGGVVVPLPKSSLNLEPTSTLSLQVEQDTLERFTRAFKGSNGSGPASSERANRLGPNPDVREESP